MSGPFARTQIVILSSIEWAATWQRHQVFAQRWAQAGHEVFFVENTGFRDPSLGDLPRIWSKARRLLFRRCAPAGIPAGLKLINPLVLPPTRAGFRRANASWFLPHLVDQLRAQGLRDEPAVVAYLPTATTLRLLDLLEPSLTVYDCVDNFRGLPAPPDDLAAMEKALVDRSDLVLATSRTLYEDKAKLHGNVIELHHGVSPDFFLPPRRPGPIRRLCYFGTLWRAVDYAPLAALAEAGFSVDLIGPQKEPPPPLPRGVTLRPPIPYLQLPRTLAGYDVLLLPYVNDEYNRGVIPAKIYECLATGRPVVASPLPALRGLRGLVATADAPQEWVEAVRGLEAGETAERRDARVAAALLQTHDITFGRLQGLVRQAWESRKTPPARQDADPGGRHVRAFLRGFSWIGLLYGLAKVSTLLTQMAAGRWLGPPAYGQANLAIAAAAYLQLLPMMGFPLAMSKFLAGAADEKDRRTLVSTTMIAFLGWAALWLAILGIGRHAVARRLGVPAGLFDLSILFAYCTAFYTVVSSPLLGMKRFEQRGLAETVYGLCAPVCLALFLRHGQAVYSDMILALCLSLTAGACYSLYVLRPYLRPAFDPAAFRLVFHYAAVATLNLLSAACILAPARLILHRHDSANEVGLFSAYFTSTAQISLALLTMMTSVLVPLASSPEGQAATWKTFRKARLRLWLGAWAAFFCAAVAALAVFGKQYAFHWEWVGLFSAAAALILIHGITSALYSARNFSGLGVSVTGGLAAGFGNIALAWALIPRWGITGAALSLIGGYLLGLACYGAYGLKETAPGPSRH